MSDTNSSLEDLLHRDEKGRFASANPPETSPQADAPQAQEPVAKPEAIAQDAAQTGVTPPSPGENSPTTEAALKAELARIRKSNRDLMARLESAPERQPQTQEPIDMFSDPDGFVSKLRGDLSDELFDRTLKLSEAFARRAYPDFEEVLGFDGVGYAAFQEIARGDPSLFDRLRESPDPASFAYEAVKLHREMQTFRDPKVRDEFRAWQKSRAGGQPSAQPAPQPVIPKTLADIPGKSSANNGTDYAGPKPLAELLPKF